MTLQEAEAVFQEILAGVGDSCLFCVLAGSARRRKPDPRDVEVVVIPNEVNVDLFGERKERHPGFVRYVDGLEQIRGRAEGKYARRRMPNGAEVDFFMASKINFGLILAIRTGPAAWCRDVLVPAVGRAGCKMEGGNLVREDGLVLDVGDEETLFNMVNLEWVDPIERGKQR